jgi:GntR family transcriptional regulator
MPIGKDARYLADHGTGGRTGEPSPLRFHLDQGSGVPTYLQLVHQVEQAARLGFLKVGDKLPRVKDAVAELAINPNTVLKAYRELEHRGIAEGRPGQGTFVRAVPTVATLSELTGLRRTLLGWMSQAAGTGLDDDAMTALFASTLRDFRGGLSPAQQGPDRSAHGAA